MENETKKKSRICGFLALVFALIGFFGDPPILTVIVSVVAIVLAVLAFVRKERWKILAIFAILISLLSFMATIATGGTNQPASKEDKAPASAEATSNVEKEPEIVLEDQEVSIGGITFVVPGEYESNGKAAFENGNKGIIFQIVSGDLTDEQFESVADKLDTQADNFAAGILTDPSRKSALPSEIAGFQARSYCYVGEKEGQTVWVYFEFINNTEKKHLNVVLGVAMDAEKEELVEAYDAVIASAKYTNASDTISSAKSETSVNTEAPDGVNEDLVAFLAEYEDFMDQYVEFMQKYSENPTDLTLLAEYSKMMKELEEFSEKADAYDETQMSAADQQYYLEVLNRCNMKMLNALGSMGN